MNIPKEVEIILSIIEDSGEEAYIVGGCVRDYFLGKIPKDYDITTSMNPDDVMLLFKKNKYNVVPTGLKHGTITIFPNNSEEGYEITTYRTDGEYLDGRHPESVSFTKSIKDDLSRRDLTINAIAYSPKRGFVDLFGGQEDIKNKVIKAIGKPEDRIEEDSLRMMRAIRFSAQFGFTIEDSLMNALKKKSSGINNVSKERIHDELCKIILSDNPDYVRILQETGLLKHFLPEVHLCFMCKQNNPWHLYNVGEHTMVALKNSPKDLTLRMSILLHDIGKPNTKTTDDKGIDHFYNHAEESSLKTKEIMKRLKFTTKETEDVAKLVLIHDYQLEASKKAIRRFVSKFELDERLFKLFIELKKSDNRGQNLELSSAMIEKTELIEGLYEEIKNQPMTVRELNINGYDIMNLGYKNEKIGIVLKNLLEKVIDDPELNKKEILLKLIE